MTNAKMLYTVIENTVNNQRKQNKHLGIKEVYTCSLLVEHSLFEHIGSV